MSYPMVHMMVAYRLLARWDRIERQGDFILGAVAPDAVHFHDPYTLSMKEKSHIWSCGPHWGITIEGDRWREEILRFWDQHKQDDNRDFMAGYCVHLLTDWENDRRIWRPFRDRVMKGEEYDATYAIYAGEARGIDQWLHRTGRDTEGIWRLLEEGHVYGVDGCILAEDLARQKDSLLHEQYVGEKIPDVSEYQYCTAEIMEELIGACVNNISCYKKI